MAGSHTHRSSNTMSAALAAAPNKKKYLLFKKEDGRPGEVKPCAFFLSPAGCKNGTNCPFSHTLTASTAAAIPSSIPPAKLLAADSRASQKRPLNDESESSDPSVSDGSDNEDTGDQPAFNFTPAKDLNKKNDQRASASKSGNKQATNSGNKRSRRNSGVDDDETDFLFSAVNQVLQGQMTSPVLNVHSSNGYGQYQQPPLPTQYNAPPPPAAHQYQTNGGYQQPAPSQNQQYHQQHQQHQRAYNQPVAAAVQHSSQYTYPLPQPSALQQPNVQPQAQQSRQMIPQPTQFKPEPQVHQQPVYQPPKQSNQIPQQQQIPQQPVPSKPKAKKEPSQNNPQSQPPAVPQGPMSWMNLVQQTLTHPRYAKDFVFPIEDSQWVTPKQYGDWAKGLPDIISIDCEMCETTDPVTGNKDQSSLIRVSVVDGMNPSNVLLDMYAMPSLPISDLKTNIHGISEDMLRGPGVATSLRHVQARILGLCSDRTIIVGHAVYNDFKAMQFKHKMVVDTSYLYSLDAASAGVGSAAFPSPSLREIADIVLKNPLPSIHNSIEDAQTAARAAVFILLNGPQAPILRSSGKLATNNAVNNGPHTLLLHRIPDEFDENAIHQLILSNTYVAPHTVQKITGGGGGAQTPGQQGRGRCVVVFASKEHASLAFESISGAVRPDNQNKPQKRVYLKGGGYIAVRKND